MQSLSLCIECNSKFFVFFVQSDFCLKLVTFIRMLDWQHAKLVITLNYYILFNSNFIQKATEFNFSVICINLCQFMFNVKDRQVDSR